MMNYKNQLTTRQNEIQLEMEDIMSQNSVAGVNFDNMKKSVNKGTFSPVKVVEEMLGIYGVAEEYKFPENIPPLEYEGYMYPANIFQLSERIKASPETQEVYDMLKPVDEKCKGHIVDMYNSLVELNPKLKSIPVNPDITFGYISVVSGVCSSFPFDDIKAFCSALMEKDDTKMKELNCNREEYSNNIRNLIISKGMPKNSKNILLLQTRMSRENIFKNWAPTKSSYEKVYQRLDMNIENQRVQEYENFMSYRFRDY